MRHSASFLGVLVGFLLRGVGDHALLGEVLDFAIVVFDPVLARDGVLGHDRAQIGLSTCPRHRHPRTENCVDQIIVS